MLLGLRYLLLPVRPLAGKAQPKRVVVPRQVSHRRRHRPRVEHATRFEQHRLVEPVRVAVTQ
jgi:hypothetical protein